MDEAAIEIRQPEEDLHIMDRFRAQPICDGVNLPLVHPHTSS
jgi:hypothetical protein